MSLTDILHEAIARVNGSQLAGIIGADGLGVEMVIKSDDLPYDREMVEIELASLASAAALASNRLGMGAVRDLIVEMDRATYVASSVVPGYFVVLGVNPNGNLGRARFAVRQMVEQLKDEM